jgi:cobalamin biosynthesis protein CobT
MLEQKVSIIAIETASVKNCFYDFHSALPPYRKKKPNLTRLGSFLDQSILQMNSYAVCRRANKRRSRSIAFGNRILFSR